jgi:tight adherence protein B
MTTLLMPLAYVLAFIATVLAIQSLAGLIFSASDRSRRVNRRLDMLRSGMDPGRVYSTLVRPSAGRAVAGARLSGLLEAIGTYCQQGGLTIAPLRLLAITAAGAGALWVVSLLVLGSGGGPGLLVNGAASLVGACALAVSMAWFWVGRRRNARLKKLEEQMPLALDVINRAVRAGHPVVSAVQLAAEELGDPIGTEFGLIIDETTYGADFKDALLSFARRTGSEDAHFFAASIAIQSETGGNLAEILHGLASVIRGRLTLAKRVKALASEGKASATVLSVLPIILVSVMTLARPAFYTSKFSDPIFWPSVVGILVLYCIGQIMFYRIVNFKY